MQLTWHSYRYLPYEKELASREVLALLNISMKSETDGPVLLSECAATEPAKRLTYFSGFLHGPDYVETVQHQLETAARSGKNRQATRYSVHGLHEYKGKFNPQVVRALLNIFRVRAGASVLDPFCGSGTTLVECAHLGARGYGFDINPFAVYVANAKLQALACPSTELWNILASLTKRLNQTKKWDIKIPDGARERYLASWFTPTVLQQIEVLRAKIQDTAGPLAPIFLTIASNLLRDYSLQDPNDLRIRRRESPLPDTALKTAFLSACDSAIQKLEAAQAVLGVRSTAGLAKNCDINVASRRDFGREFDAAITSPPYAMALPYIDTQRLSLVWLELLSPDKIGRLEADLIGSREVRGTGRKTLHEVLMTNASDVPAEELEFCLQLQRALGKSDGFRREAVPILLYRYFAAMQKSFQTVLSTLKRGGRYGLIVGHNHTVLGGVKRDINTPAHLVSIAQSVGWKVDEAVPLQTYQRYGYHANNAVRAETLILLSKH
ncbi:MULTISPECIES: TRM11 family SAM-dependent methyltransferase [unclassified Bradyrhizobium]|uniref:TRM11 family SAM-dependent methyltransferase n=1 Tax=unclassified Bradyrhizobium TaxID=2631580 RepID=UPI002915F884|nr:MULTISPECIES: DNA methyltransferase [unclassified Bradyrhizobium]